MSQFELMIMDNVNSLVHCQIMDTLMPVITRLGDGGAVWIVLCLVLLVFPKTRKIGAAIGISLLIEIICCNLILKPLVARPRPFDINEGISLLIARPDDYSFPSGHTGASFAATSVLWRCDSKLKVPALILAVLIAFSRMYLYVHYPSDILTGMLLGTAAGIAGTVILERAERFMERRKTL